MSPDDPDIHTLTPAYVVDALSAAERATVEVHLGSCSRCADEVARLREAAAHLGGLLREPVGDGLRANVLAAIEETPQDDPAEGGPPDLGSAGEMPQADR